MHSNLSAYKTPLYHEARGIVKNYSPPKAIDTKFSDRHSRDRLSPMKASHPHPTKKPAIVFDKKVLSNLDIKLSYKKLATGGYRNAIGNKTEIDSYSKKDKRPFDKLIVNK